MPSRPEIFCGKAREIRAAYHELMALYATCPAARLPVPADARVHRCTGTASLGQVHGAVPPRRDDRQKGEGEIAPWWRRVIQPEQDSETLVHKVPVGRTVLQHACLARASTLGRLLTFVSKKMVTGETGFALSLASGRNKKNLPRESFCLWGWRTFVSIWGPPCCAGGKRSIMRAGRWGGQNAVGT